MNKILRHKFFVPLLHVSIWALLFSLPYVLLSGQGFETERTFEHLWAPLAFYALIFYTNYAILVDRFLVRRKVFVFVLLNLALIALFIWLKFEMRDLMSGHPGGPKPGGNPPPLRFFIYLDGISFLVPVLFAIGLRIFDRWIRSESERKESENARLATELQHLKYQLQPHFFFNSLNNIYSLVDISPEQAKETIHSLGVLMRYLLYDTNSEFVPLRKEVDFMKQYIALMDLRTSSKTVVKADFPHVVDEVRVAPLLFISLIENAFKHGVSATGNSELDFRLSVSDGKVIFESANGNFRKRENDRSGSGIGLQNLRKRLELLYPNKHSFAFGNDAEVFRTKLVIDLKP
ncbi:histidine kinase [Flavobacterium sp.]|uniref:sensor histidine kinase n=1 Tax=Flavobacterium sp. TaxID=239 RepID=UPI0011F4AFFE|nr:histidine kinase [Flavobacterium sp.]RZJ72283.1 MAG: histidine kinase [Flavobacterium sp.]